MSMSSMHSECLSTLFTFKVMPGVQKSHTIRCIYRNQSNDQVEEISPSSKSTPRDKKKRLGPVTSVSRVDEFVFVIKNSAGDSINLAFKNLRPSILIGSDPLKETLSALQDKSQETMISVLCRFLEKFEFETRDEINSQADMFETSQIPESSEEELASVSIDSGLVTSGDLSSVQDVSIVSHVSDLEPASEFSNSYENNSENNLSEKIQCEDRVKSPDGDCIYSFSEEADENSTSDRLPSGNSQSDEDNLSSDTIGSKRSFRDAFPSENKDMVSRDQGPSISKFNEKIRDSDVNSNAIKDIGDEMAIPMRYLTIAM